MIIDEIRTELKKLQDVKYREMQIRIIPTVKPESIIGVRTPELRQMAKQYAQAEDIGVFLKDLPHQYFDEDQLDTGLEKLSELCEEAGINRTTFYLHYNDTEQLLLNAELLVTWLIVLWSDKQLRLACDA